MNTKWSPGSPSTPTSVSTLRRIQVGDVELALEDHGRGEPLVLVHGFPFDRRMWRGQIGAFDGFRLILPDVRGHGESEPAPPPYSMTTLAEDLRQLLDHLGLDRVVIGGLSMGGYIALAFAARYPERLSALLLIDTQAAADSPEAREKRAELSARARRDGVEAVAGEMLERLVGGRNVTPEVADLVRQMILGTSVEGMVGALAGMAARPDSTPLLPKIACPTLVVVGQDDAVTPPETARSMAAAIPRAELVEIPSAGHLAPLEQPPAVNAAIRSFLSRALARPAAR